jgi:ATP-dependent Lon protease
MMMPFVIGRPSSIRALEHALGKDKRIFLAAQHDAAIDEPQPNDIFTMGCIANIVQSLKLPTATSRCWSRASIAPARSSGRKTRASSGSS